MSGLQCTQKLYANFCRMAVLQTQTVRIFDKLEWSLRSNRIYFVKPAQCTRRLTPHHLADSLHGWDTTETALFLLASICIDRRRAWSSRQAMLSMLLLTAVQHMRLHGMRASEEPWSGASALPRPSPSLGPVLHSFASKL